jgi:hypothetical protein
MGPHPVHALLDRLRVGRGTAVSAGTSRAHGASIAPPCELADVHAPLETRRSARRGEAPRSSRVGTRAVERAPMLGSLRSSRRCSQYPCSMCCAHFTVPLYIVTEVRPASLDVPLSIVS